MGTNSSSKSLLEASANFAPPIPSIYDKVANPAMWTNDRAVSTGTKNSLSP